MSTPLSFCDISARYGQTPAPRKTPEEQTGWNFNLLFNDYLSKVRAKREEDEAHASEDALMAMIDAINAPKEDRRTDQDKIAVQSLAKAGAALAQSEKFKDIQKKFDGKADITVLPEIRAMMACLGDASMFRQADDIQEKLREQIEEEKRLKVTQARSHSEPSDLKSIERR